MGTTQEFQLFNSKDFLFVFYISHRLYLGRHINNCKFSYTKFLSVVVFDELLQVFFQYTTFKMCFLCGGFSIIINVFVSKISCTIFVFRNFTLWRFNERENVLLQFS